LEEWVGTGVARCFSAWVFVLRLRFWFKLRLPVILEVFEGIIFTIIGVVGISVLIVFGSGGGRVWEVYWRWNKCFKVIHVVLKVSCKARRFRCLLKRWVGETPLAVKCTTKCLATVAVKMSVKPFCSLEGGPRAGWAVALFGFKV
jgi:hypothetical protein